LDCIVSWRPAWASSGDTVSKKTKVNYIYISQWSPFVQLICAHNFFKVTA
jgi:hypothetical protein